MLKKKRAEIKEEKEEGEKRQVQVEEERNADMAPPGQLGWMWGMERCQ